MISVTLISAVVVGLIAGFIADSTLTKGHGLQTNLAAGVVGALAIPFLLDLVGITLVSGLPLAGALNAAIGAVVMFFVLKIATKTA